MTTPTELVREHMPGATDEEVHFVLWNKTAFPAGTPDLWKEQVKHYVRAKSLGRVVCAFCGKMRWPSQVDPWDMCSLCAKKWEEWAQN